MNSVLMNYATGRSAVVAVASIPAFFRLVRLGTQVWCHSRGMWAVNVGIYL